jgi:ABC-type sugar transport system substrate-binding protein
MPPFEKGNKAAVGAKRGKNRITNDVRQVFHKVYDEMGKDEEVVDEATGEKRPQTGHEAMLKWAMANQTEFYRLYGKMIPATAELAEDMHEDFVANLIFEEEQDTLVETTATDVGNNDQLQLPSGETVPDTAPPMGDNPIKE